MTLACAKRCNLERLINKQYMGLARGIGVQKIIGRIYSGYYINIIIFTLLII